MSNENLVKTLHEIGAAQERFNSVNDAWQRKHSERLDEFSERLEQLETRASSPRAGGSKSREAVIEQREHKTRFEAWLRRPHDGAMKNALNDFEVQAKAVSIASNPGGGFAVPEEIAREIERLEIEFSPVRSLVKVMRVGSNDNKHLVNIRGATAGWIGEAGTRSETDTSLLRERAPTMGELYAYPQTTEWALDDVFFNVGDWLAEEVAQQFAQMEGQAVIDGNGSDRPTGILNSAPTAVADFNPPMRAAAVYEFVPSLATNSPATAMIVPDSLITLVYKVNSMYRTGASWAMNSATAAAIRKLKDNEGRYLWQPGLAFGQPDSLFGYPVAIWEQLPDIATNAHPVAFGNFRRGYLLVDRTDIRITVDANITTPGRVKYFVRRREGGCPLNNDSLKMLKTTIA